MIWLLVAQLAQVTFTGKVVPGLAWSGPRLTPAEAAAVMARLDSPANFTRFQPCRDCDGPKFFTTGSPSSKDWPTERPARRLDGTLLSEPPQLYGPAFYPIPIVVRP